MASAVCELYQYPDYSDTPLTLQVMDESVQNISLQGRDAITLESLAEEITLKFSAMDNDWYSHSRINLFSRSGVATMRTASLESGYIWMSDTATFKADGSVVYSPYGSISTVVYSQMAGDDLVDRLYAFIHLKPISGDWQMNYLGAPASYEREYLFSTKSTSDNSFPTFAMSQGAVAKVWLSYVVFMKLTITLDSGTVIEYNGYCELPDDIEFDDTEQTCSISFRNIKHYLIRCMTKVDSDDVMELYSEENEVRDFMNYQDHIWTAEGHIYRIYAFCELMLKKALYPIVPTFDYTDGDFTDLFYVFLTSDTFDYSPFGSVDTLPCNLGAYASENIDVFKRLFLQFIEAFSIEFDFDGSVIYFKIKPDGNKITPDILDANRVSLKRSIPVIREEIVAQNAQDWSPIDHSISVGENPNRTLIVYRDHTGSIAPKHLLQVYPKDMYEKYRYLSQVDVEYNHVIDGCEVKIGDEYDYESDLPGEGTVSLIVVGVDYDLQEETSKVRALRYVFPE